MMNFLVTYKSIFVVAHALAAAVGLGAVIVTDSLFFRYLKDFKISAKEEETMSTISRVVWAAIALLIITGAALFFSGPLDYLTKSKFIIKMVVFAVIVVNGVVLSVWISPYLKKISFGPVEKQPATKIRVIRRIAFAAGVVSLISWVTVFILGSVRSIPLTVGQGLVGYAILVGLGVLGSQGYATWVKYQTILPPQD